MIICDNNAAQHRILSNFLYDYIIEYFIQSNKNYYYKKSIFNLLSNSIYFTWQGRLEDDSESFALA